MIPCFAVVGHPNKGKSSIVATLAEDDEVHISATPGTTRRAHKHTLSIDGVAMYALVDTPGFQRPGAVLNWLEERASSARERATLVREFVDAHQHDERFRDECELLGPIVDGAGILYVVDGAKPYGAEYEVEMQVLQWTGRPRMALINMIGRGDHVEEWRQALGQYFSIVRVFDAVHADFGKRVALLRAFAELEESWRPALERAVAALETERRLRLQRSAAQIAECLIDCLTMSERRGLAEGADARELQDQLTVRLQNRITHREAAARELVQSLYRHAGLRQQETTAQELLATELFTEEGWELFGLSHQQLLVTGMVSGAVAGGGIDALLGGATLLLGAGIGAVVGAVGAWLAGEELAKVKVLGQSLGGRALQVGPVTNPNFPWVLLGRAWAHHRVVSERNHARREAMSVALSEQQHLMDSMPDVMRRRLGVTFKKITAAETDSAARQDLTELIERLLEVSSKPPPSAAPEQV